ncbi:hypothetical protein HMPREF0528_0007, partial [Lactobacillus johnsonii ATCC 33200]
MGLETMMRQANAGRDDWAEAGSASLASSKKGDLPVMSDSSGETQRDL